MLRGIQVKCRRVMSRGWLVLLQPRLIGGRTKRATFAGRPKRRGQTVKSRPPTL